MLAIIGTYRKQEYVPALLASLEEFATGIDRIVFIDDSNDPETAEYLRQYGNVIETFGAGYGEAMRAAVEIGRAERDHVVWLEEDFRITAPVDFEQLSSILDTHPMWAQIVLKRQAWYPVEIEAGGVLEAVQRTRHEVHLYDDFYTHTAFFSCNPSIWRREIWRYGWPHGENSEYKMYRLLKGYGYKFAMTPEITCLHDGVRSGKGY